MEKRIILGIIIGASVLFLMIYAATSQIQNQARNLAMPWDSYKNPQGKTVAFGLTLGQATLGQAMQYFGTEAKVSLFETDDKKYSLEVYLNSSKAGAIKAQVVLNLSLTPEKRQYLLANATKKQRMPSKNNQYSFAPFVQNKLLELTVSGISFIPKANLDKTVIIARFGQPDNINTISKILEKWHYHKKGLILTFHANNKEILEYQ